MSFSALSTVMVIAPGGNRISYRRARIPPTAWRRLTPYIHWVHNYPALLDRLDMPPETLQAAMYFAIGHPSVPADERACAQHRELAKVGYATLVRAVVKVGHDLGLCQWASTTLSRWICGRALPTIALEAGLIGAGGHAPSSWAEYNCIPEVVPARILCAAIATCACLLDPGSLHGLIVDVVGPWVATYLIYHMQRRLKNIVNPEGVSILIHAFTLDLLRPLPLYVPTRVGMVSGTHVVSDCRRFWDTSAWYLEYLKDTDEPEGETEEGFEGIEEYEEYEEYQ